MQRTGSGPPEQIRAVRAHFRPDKECFPTSTSDTEAPLIPQPFWLKSATVVPKHLVRPPPGVLERRVHLLSGLV